MEFRQTESAFKRMWICIIVQSKFNPFFDKKMSGENGTTASCKVRVAGRKVDGRISVENAEKCKFSTL